MVGNGNANRIPFEFFAMCRCHLLSPLTRAELSEDRNETGTASSQLAKSGSVADEHGRRAAIRCPATGNRITHAPGRLTVDEDRR